MEKEYALKLKTDPLLGEGGFAKVYLGSKKIDKTKVAVKVIEHSRSKQLLRMIQNERQINMSVHHANIIRFHHYFHQRHRHYFIFEYAEGGTLYEQLKRVAALEEKIAAEIIVQVVAATTYLHQKNIIYRDLKPENILLMKKDSYVVKLADFGLSVVKTGTPIRDCVGTTEYMAPEVIAKREYDHRVDIWSLAILLYELLTAKTPFIHVRDQNCRQQICKAPVQFPTCISRSAIDLIEKLLQRDPDDRITLAAASKHLFLEPHVEPAMSSVMDLFINLRQVVLSRCPSPRFRREDSTEGSSRRQISHFEYYKGLRLITEFLRPDIMAWFHLMAPTKDFKALHIEPTWLLSLLESCHTSKISDQITFKCIYVENWPNYCRPLCRLCPFVRKPIDFRKKLRTAEKARGLVCGHLLTTHAKRRTPIGKSVKTAANPLYVDFTVTITVAFYIELLDHIVNK